MFYIKNSMFDKFVSYIKLIEPDYDVHQLLSDVGLSASELSNSELFLDYTKIAKLLSLAARELAQPLFSLKYAQYAIETNKALMDKALPLLKTLDMAYHFYCEYISNHTNTMTIEREIVGDRIFLYWSIKCDTHNDDWFQANLLSAFRMYQPLHKIISQNFSDGMDIIIHLPGKYASLANDIRHHFEGVTTAERPVFMFNGTCYAISYPVKYNDKTFDMQTKELFEIIEDISSINAVRPGVNFSVSVSDAVKNCIMLGEQCDLSSISKLFYMHPRTLQNKLSGEGCKFSDILEQVRKEVSVEMLCDESTPIYSIAAMLGFSDSAIFSRAFKVWFNLSPSQWRRQHKKSTNSIN